VKPDISASTISNKCPEKYDVFAQVCGAGTYIANVRLQELFELPVDPQQAIIFKCALERSLQFVDTFRKVAAGSETMIVDCNVYDDYG